MPVEELNPFRKVLVNPSKHSEDQIRENGPSACNSSGAGTQEAFGLIMIRINLPRTQTRPPRGHGRPGADDGHRRSDAASFSWARAQRWGVLALFLLYLSWQKQA